MGDEKLTLVDHARATGAELFTPNTSPRSRERYLLYRAGPGLFSTIPGGRQYPYTSAPADCGLGCRCAAIITRTTPAGRRALAKAARIDSMGREV